MSNKYFHLSAEERGRIEGMKETGTSANAIALALGRSPSTISRELRRNGFKPPHEIGKMGRPRISGGYHAHDAGMRSRRMRKLRQRPCKLNYDSALWKTVYGLLAKYWSPEQIAAKLRNDHPGQLHLQASHETIYTAIYAAPRGTLRKELVSFLRQERSARKPLNRKADQRGALKEMVSIHLRPPEAEDRLLPGHWEGDLIIGANNRSCVGTFVCRKTLFLMLVKMDGGPTALNALRGYSQAFSPLDPALRQTLTYDQGKEMTLHRELAETTGLKIYFADPHSPWQRGINENTNGLIRQYLPKGTNLSVHSQRELDWIAMEMNTRPRKTLQWKTPAEVLAADCQIRNIPTKPLVALGL